VRYSNCDDPCLSRLVGNLHTTTGLAAGGAPAFVCSKPLAVGPLFSMQNRLRRHGGSAETARLADKEKTETLIAKAPAQERAALKSDRSEDTERSADLGEPVSAPLPRPPSELPPPTSSQTTSTAPSDWAAQTPDAPAPSSVVKEKAPIEAQPSGEPSEPSRTQMPESQQPVPQAPGPQPAPRTELASVASPEIEAKQSPPTAAAGQEPKSEPVRSDGNRKAQAVDKKPKKRLNVPRVAATRTPNKLKESEREPRLVSSRSTALRWPSADEPFVNLGARNR